MVQVHINENPSAVAPVSLTEGPGGLAKLREDRNKKVEFVDRFGRQIRMRKVTLSMRHRIADVLGDAVKNEGLMLHAFAVMSLESIGEHPVVALSRTQIDATLDLLEVEGVEDVLVKYAEEFGTSPAGGAPANEAAAKNG